MSKRIIVIVGPTASGKSRLGLSLARSLDGEIVSADSVQVYRGLDIGSAKATPAEREEVPHHLLDVADPRDRFSAATYARLASAAIDDVLARGKVPILVGGTGLYVRALLFGLADAAPSDPKMRASLDAELARDGSPVMHARLREIDPIAAERIHPNDAVRIVRALEVYRLTGRSMSEHQAAHRPGGPRYAWAGIGLTGPRQWLWRRIAVRCEAMVEAGLIEEVEALMASGVPPTAPAFSAIGYAHVMRLWSGSLSPDDWLDRMMIDTRRYAKRQLTWFRKEEGVRWLNAAELMTSQEETRQEETLAAVRSFLAGERFELGALTESDAI